MAVATCISTGSQTLWTFPPFYVVKNCPTPPPFKQAVPKKLQTILMNRYAIDSIERSDSLTEGLLSNEDSAMISDQPSDSLQQSSLDYWSSNRFHTNALMSFDAASPNIQPSTETSEQASPDSFPVVGEHSVNAGPVRSPVDVVSSSTRSPEYEIAKFDSNLPVKPKQESTSKEHCHICGDTSAGFYWGAFVCEACKKFYLRVFRQPNRQYSCTSRSSTTRNMCSINKANRTSCQYCRYQKCLAIGMEPPGKGLLDTHNVKSLPCKVCGAPSSGFNFGVLTCEGCKGFFRRHIQNGCLKADALACQNEGSCDVAFRLKPQCRACRYNKCISMGMSSNATRIGRLPNSVRYARIVENRQCKLEAVTEHTEHTADHPSSDSYMYIDECSTSYSVSPCKTEQTSFSVPAINPSISPTKTYATPSTLCTRERAEHPMDLSLTYSMPLDLSPSIQSPMAAHRRTERLSALYENTRREYYKIITDDVMLEPGVDDNRFAQLNFEQFQVSSRLFVNFFKKVDGFMQLDLEDRVLLIKCAIYRCLLLAGSQRYDLETGQYYMFGWRSWGPAPTRLVTMYPEYKVLAYHFAAFGKRIKQIGCSSEELGLIAVLITINKDNLSDIKDTQAVSRLCDDYMELLILNAKANHIDHEERMKELNSVLDLCRQAAKEHAGAAKTVINKYPSYAAVAAQNAEIIPQLYKEMFSNTPWEHWKIS